MNYLEASGIFSKDYRNYQVGSSEELVEGIKKEIVHLEGLFL